MTSSTHPNTILPYGSMSSKVFDICFPCSITHVYNVVLCKNPQKSEIKEESFLHAQIFLCKY